MSYLSMYLISSTAETKPILEAQHKELDATNCFHCFTCDLKRHYSMGFKCLYCGAWFCFPCAEKHFNKTRQQWLEEQRAQKAAALREKIAQLSDNNLYDQRMPAERTTKAPVGAHVGQKEFIAYSTLGGHEPISLSGKPDSKGVPS